MEDDEELKSRKERAQVRLQIWLGLAKYQSEWRNDTPGGEVAVYAETVFKTSTVKHFYHTLIVLKTLRNRHQAKSKQAKGKIS